jgi:hypothetical protein
MLIDPSIRFAARQLGLRLPSDGAPRREILNRLHGLQNLYSSVRFRPPTPFFSSTSYLLAPHPINKFRTILIFAATAA